MDDLARDLGGNTPSATHLIKEALELLDPGCRIDDMQPEVRTKFRALVLVCAMIGLGRLRVVSTIRSLEEQCDRFGCGRGKDELRRAGVDPKHAKPRLKQVSWVHPKESKHVRGQGLDVSTGAYETGALGLLGHAARSLGIGWGGDWRKRDYGHFEV